MTRTLRRLYLSLAVTAGLVAAGTAPAAGGMNHCQPLLREAPRR